MSDPIAPPSPAQALPPDLSHVDTWIFDLDNTLYPASTRLFAQIDHRMTSFVSQFLSIEPTAAKALQQELFLAHGTTLSGLMRTHNINPHEFLTYVHDIDLSDLIPDTDLTALLASLPGRRLIYTNGSTDHARRITDKLGISDHFHGVQDIVAAEYVPKPSHAAFAKFLDCHEIRADTAIFFDDMPHNLLPAHDHGVTTVWIDQRSDWSRPDGTGPHVHYRADSLTEFLRDLRLAGT